MICPIIETSFRIAKPGETPLDTECLKEECAWWEREGEGCAMPLIALRLGTIAEVLDEIEKKMPH